EGANPPASSSGLDPIATVQTKLAGLGLAGHVLFPGRWLPLRDDGARRRGGNVPCLRRNGGGSVGSLGVRQWIGGAVFGPEAVKAMGQAFDQAWAEIAQNFGASPTSGSRRPFLAPNPGLGELSY